MNDQFKNFQTQFTNDLNSAADRFVQSCLEMIEENRNKTRQGTQPALERDMNSFNRGKGAFVSPFKKRNEKDEKVAAFAKKLFNRS